MKWRFINIILIGSILIYVMCAGCNFQNKTKRSEGSSDISYNTSDGLHIPQCINHYNSANVNEFEWFTVVLSNKTTYSFKMVQYRVKLYLVENDKKEEVFSKSYKSYQILNAGDMVRVPVLDLNNFFMGVDVSNKLKWTWEGIIEDFEVQR